MEDKKIIELYWKRLERAITETDLKYGKLCFQLAKNIVFDKGDAEEIVNETYLGVWNSIPPNRPEHLKTFICKITKNLAMAKVRYYNADKRQNEGIVSLDEVEDILSSKDTVEQQIEKEEISKYISDFLRTINANKRNIFLKRYWYYDSVADIARAYGISQSKVKTTLFRVRRDLKEYLQDKGVEL